MMSGEENNNVKKLKTIASIPPHLAFNKFVINGYRCNYSFKECVKSLFYLHNETLNIYSHGIMTAYLVTTLSWPKSKHPSLSFIHWIASLLPFSASTVYHLFMCHSKGSTLYHKLLSLDMIGIWAVNTFGYIIAIFTTFHCMPNLQILAVASYISFSFLALCLLVKAKTPFQRFLPLCYYLVVRPMIMLSRLYINKLKMHRNALAVWQYVLLDGFALFGAMVNVAKFPERYIPGRVDFALNSHQIMHIFTIASMYLLNTAAEHDFQFLTDTVC